MYIDDIQIYGPRGSKHIIKLKQDLHKRFAITDLGPYSYYLGIEIVRDRLNRTVRITQTTYLKKILSRFRIAFCVSALTSIAANTQLQEESINQAKSNVVKDYQSIVGSIIYVIIQTRPDICYSVTILSRYNHNPNVKYITAVKRVLRYLRGILNYSVTYRIDSGLVGYTDAD